MSGSADWGLEPRAQDAAPRRPQRQNIDLVPIAVNERQEGGNAALAGGLSGLAFTEKEAVESLGFGRWPC